MTWGMVAVGAGTAISGALGASSSKSAASAQRRAAEEAAMLEREMYHQTRTDLRPYREGGEQAMPSLVELATNPQAQADYVAANPLYRAQIQQAQNDVFANQAARGMIGSGGTAAALQDRYLAIGDTALNSQYNRLMGLAGIGQNSAAQQASANQQTGNALADLATQRGNAAAAGQVGAANAWGSALQQGASFLGDYMGRQSGSRLSYIDTGSLRPRTSDLSTLY